MTRLEINGVRWRYVAADQEWQPYDDGKGRWPFVYFNINHWRASDGSINVSGSTPRKAIRAWFVERRARLRAELSKAKAEVLRVRAELRLLKNR